MTFSHTRRPKPRNTFTVRGQTNESCFALQSCFALRFSAYSKTTHYFHSTTSNPGPFFLSVEQIHATFSQYENKPMTLGMLAYRQTTHYFHGEIEPVTRAFLKGLFGLLRLEQGPRGTLSMRIFSSFCSLPMPRRSCLHAF
jgi:hypothetical protein